MKKLTFTRFRALDYACTEALNTLCTNLTFSGSNVKKIMITSCQSSEGKSFLTMNMMRTFSNLGKRVVVVDCDLRRSMVASRYGIRMPEGEERGMAHFLAGMCPLEEVLYATNIDDAYMVPVGREVSNSLSLLSTPRLTMLLNQLAKMFDVVLVDAPPVGVIIDAAEIAKSCDGTLLAVSYNKVSRRELAEVKRQIERTGCRMLGAVLNGVRFDSYSSKRYYSKSYYTHYNMDHKPEKSPKGDKKAGKEQTAEGK